MHHRRTSGRCVARQTRKFTGEKFSLRIQDTHEAPIVNLSDILDSCKVERFHIIDSKSRYSSEYRSSSPSMASTENFFKHNLHLEGLCIFYVIMKNSLGASFFPLKLQKYTHSLRSLFLCNSPLSPFMTSVKKFSKQKLPIERRSTFLVIIKTSFEATPSPQTAKMAFIRNILRDEVIFSTAGAR